MNDINYPKWIKRDLWVLWEGIYILLGREPNLSEFVQKDTLRYRDRSFWNKFDEIAELARGSIDRYILKVELDPPNYIYCELIPLTFLNWAQIKKLNIAEELLLLLMQTDYKEMVSSITTNLSTQIIDYQGKPSDTCQAKTEFILKALEDIAESLKMAINRAILWSQLIEKCNSSESFRFEVIGKNKFITEKLTKYSWDREGLKIHLDRVIAWHKQNNPQFYSQFDQK